VAVLSSDHVDTVQSIQFNPKYMMFATACQQMVRIILIKNLNSIILIPILGILVASY